MTPAEKGKRYHRLLSRQKKARKARRRAVAKIHRAAEKPTPKKRLNRFRRMFHARALVERFAELRRGCRAWHLKDRIGRDNSDWTRQTARDKWLANVNRKRGT